MVASFKKRFKWMPALCLAGSALALCVAPVGASQKFTPTVKSTTPANHATGVSVNKKITVTFNKAMYPGSINTNNFVITAPGALAVSGTVRLDGSGTTATFNPDAKLAASTLYTATVTTGAKSARQDPSKRDDDDEHDEHGDASLADQGLARNYQWTFTTGATVDKTAPRVTSTTPADTATAVLTNSTVTATFSEAMAPSTITSATFTVQGPGASAVAGAVSYDATTNIASFTPTAVLASGTTYSATIVGDASGATDLAGNALASNKVWSFTTDTRIVSAGPVALGAAAPFGAFGGNAGITNQGILTLVNGDIGTTAASTLITGFHDTANNVYTETPLNVGAVNGLIYTAPPAPGTAESFAIATQVAADAQTAFNNLSPASLPGGTDPFAGELGGKSVAPGVYQSASGTFQITGSDLTLDAMGDANATWVFQAGSSLTVGDTAPRSVILINGAQAKNVFWQVGSNATINGAGGGTMVGTIIASAGVTFSTAGNVEITTLNGRALGLNASVTMVNTNINVPAP